MYQWGCAVCVLGLFVHSVMDQAHATTALFWWVAVGVCTGAVLLECARPVTPHRIRRDSTVISVGLLIALSGATLPRVIANLDQIIPARARERCVQALICAYHR